MATAQLSGITGDRDGVQRDVGLLGPLEARARERDLASIERQLKDKGDAVEDRQDRVRTKGPQMSALNAEISAEGRLKKNIADNIEARRMARDLAQLRDETRRKKEEVDRDNERGRGGDGGAGMSLRDAERERDRCLREADKLKEKRAQLVGQLEALKVESLGQGNKLESANYRGIDEKHRHKSIEYETCNMAVNDLGIYYDALDTALQVPRPALALSLARSLSL